MTLPTDKPDCRLIEWESTTPLRLTELLQGDPVVIETATGYTCAFELADRVIWVQDDQSLSTQVCNLLWARENAPEMYRRWWHWRESKRGRALLMGRG